MYLSYTNEFGRFAVLRFHRFVRKSIYFIVKVTISIFFKANNIPTRHVLLELGPGCKCDKGS